MNSVERNVGTVRTFLTDLIQKKYGIPTEKQLDATLLSSDPMIVEDLFGVASMHFGVCLVLQKNAREYTLGEAVELVASAKKIW